MDDLYRRLKMLSDWCGGGLGFGEYDEPMAPLNTLFLIHGE